MYLLIAITTYFQACAATYVISVYGDVYMDKDFFTRTYPWLIDNIGGEIAVDYHLLGSGRYTVPQMCALSEMKMNTFLQAQYLKCEAEGNQSEICLCASGIDPEKYKHCVLTKGTLASFTASKYSQLGIDAQPVIEIGYKNTIFGVEDSWYLKKICTIFGDNAPRGCVKPFTCNATESYPTKNSIVQYDCPKSISPDLRISVTCDNTNRKSGTQTTTNVYSTPTTISTSISNSRYFTTEHYDLT